MPDPIRVTRAVRRCVVCDTDIDCDMPDCTDGWVDVPVDEECPNPGHLCGCAECRRMIKVRGCCGGSGRRLHNWATGWCIDDGVLMPDGSTESIQCSLDVIDLGRIGALVLSDPSHRPEPMRWKQ